MGSGVCGMGNDQGWVDARDVPQGTYVGSRRNRMYAMITVMLSYEGMLHLLHFKGFSSNGLPVGAEGCRSREGL